jgi:hypothetical protein
LPEFRVDVLRVTPKECGYKATWLKSSPKRPKRPQVWDDEAKPSAPKFGEFLSTPEYEVVIGILREITSLWKRNPRNPKLDRKLWAMSILEHLRGEFDNEGKGPFREWLQQHFDEDFTIRWIAHYSAAFSMWAAGDRRDLPAGFVPPDGVVPPRDGDELQQDEG